MFKKTIRSRSEIKAKLVLRHLLSLIFIFPAFSQDLFVIATLIAHNCNLFKLKIFILICSMFKKKKHQQTQKQKKRNKP